MKNVKKISDRAEQATGDVAEIASMVSRKLAPIAMSGVTAAVLRWLKNKKSKDKD